MDKIDRVEDRLLNEIEALEESLENLSVISQFQNNETSSNSKESANGISGNQVINVKFAMGCFNDGKLSKFSVFPFPLQHDDPVHLHQKCLDASDQEKRLG